MNHPCQAPHALDHQRQLPQTLVLPRDLQKQESLKYAIDSHCQLPLSTRLLGDTCAICFDNLSDLVETSDGLDAVHFGFDTNALEIDGCGHCFHKACLERWFQERRSCPVCSQSCGPVFGNGPSIGQMTWRQEKSLLPGHLDASGSLVLSFSFPQGVDDCGLSYSGRSVEAFLPDSPLGWQVTELFQIAFKRRLLFSLGLSLTKNVRWPTFNIHMKTNRLGGIASHGYPDPSYISRACTELSEYGIQMDPNVTTVSAQMGSESSEHRHFTENVSAPPATQRRRPNPLLAHCFSREPQEPQSARNGPITSEVTAASANVLEVVQSDSLVTASAPLCCPQEGTEKDLGDVPSRAVTCVHKNKCMLCGIFVPDDQNEMHAQIHISTQVKDLIRRPGETLEDQYGPLGGIESRDRRYCSAEHRDGFINSEGKPQGWPFKPWECYYCGQDLRLGGEGSAQDATDWERPRKSLANDEGINEEDRQHGLTCGQGGKADHDLPSSAERFAGGDCSTTAGLEPKSIASSSSDYWQQDSVSVGVASLDLVPCEYCDTLVPFDDYSAHVASKHNLNDQHCACCGNGFTNNDGAGQTIDGVWSKATIEGTILTWEDGEQTTLELISPKVIQMTSMRGQTYTGVLVEDGRLWWSDGDVWTKGEQTDLCPSCRPASVPVPEPYMSATPESLAMQMVEMVRCAGEELAIFEASEVCNFDLAVGFVCEFFFHCTSGLPLHEDMVELVYHWTREDNITAIMNNNLRIAGDTNSDGTRIQTANGDKYGPGIYAATDMDFGRRYGKGASGALLCLALPGSVLHGRKKISERLPSGQLPDSICDGPVRVYRTSAQILPLFVTDRKHDAQVRAAALDVSKFLQKHVNLIKQA